MISIKPIRIFTPELKLLAEIEDYESLIFTRRWHRPGDFGLQININKNNTEFFQKGNIIALTATKAGIIKHREIKVDQGGKGTEALAIKGWTLSGITRQRLTVPPADRSYDRINSNIETIMKAYVNNNLINPEDPDRVFSMLVNAYTQERGQRITWQTRYKQLDEELERLSLLSGMGWNIYLDFDKEKWIFEIYEGRVLSANQEENNPVIFSTDYDNIQSQGYFESDLNYKNVGYTAGQGEGDEREIVEVGHASGLSRHEVFIDARDIGEGSEDPPPSPEEITARLFLRGQQRLQEYPQLETFEAEILTYGPFAYEKDWDLGDIVTVQNKKWGVTLNSRIIEVSEIYEASGFRLDVIFGNNIPTLMDKLRSELGQFRNEITK